MEIAGVLLERPLQLALGHPFSVRSRCCAFGIRLWAHREAGCDCELFNFITIDVLLGTK